MFYVELLGEFTLRDGKKRIFRLGTRKSQWLLAYLLLHPGGHARDRIAPLLWPDSSEANADNSLRQAIFSLKSVLEPKGIPAGSFLIVKQATLEFNRKSEHCLDIDRFESLIKDHDPSESAQKIKALEAAVALYQGDLLEECYDDWCVEPREHLKELYLQSLEALVRLFAEKKDYVQAIHYAKQILAKSPLQEETHRQLMYLYYASGDRNAALQQYRECKRILTKELGIDPLPETSVLFHEIEERTSPARLEELAIEARRVIHKFPGLGAPFVGREKEFQQLVVAWETATQEQGKALFIAGEAGVGKSRLAGEFINYVAQQKGLIFSGRCYEVEGKLPYQVLIESLREGLTQIPSKSLSGLSPIWLAEVVRLVPEWSEKISLAQRKAIIPQSEPPSKRLASLDQERNRLFEAVTQLFIHLSQQQPVLIFWDDLQWVDETTLQLLHYLVRRLAGHKLLFLGTYRREEVTEAHRLWEALQPLARDELMARVDLRSLKEAEIGELVKGMLKADKLEELRQQVYAQSHGVPLFAVELLKAMIEAQVLSLDAAGDWQLRDIQLGADHISPTVRSVIEMRLRRIARPSRQLLDLAAVMGRAMTTEQFAQSTGKSQEEILDSIEELVQALLIVEKQGEYSVRHDLIRQAVYVALLPERRQHLHKRAGELLEQLSEESLDKIIGELAHHFLEAGEKSWSKALHYSLRAGEAAQKVYANKEAIAHFQQAFELAERLKDKDALRIALTNLSHLCVHSGRIDDGLAYGQKALELTKDQHERARIHETMADGYNYKIEHEKALSCCEQAIKELGKKDKSLEMAKIYDKAALMLCQLHHPREAIKFSEKSIKILDKLGRFSQMVVGLSRMGMAFHTADLEQSIKYDSLAVEYAEKARDLNAMAEAYYESGLTYSLKDDGAHAINFFEKALSTYEKLGDFIAVIWSHQLLCRALIQCGQIDRALVQAQKGLELATQFSEVREKATLHGYLGCIYLAQGLKKESQEEFSIAIASRNDDGMIYTSIVLTLTLLNQFDAALEWIRKGLPYMSNERIRYLKIHPNLRSLREQPKSKSLFRHSRFSS